MLQIPRLLKRYKISSICNMLLKDLKLGHVGRKAV